MKSSELELQQEISFVYAGVFGNPVKGTVVTIKNGWIGIKLAKDIGKWNSTYKKGEYCSFNGKGMIEIEIIKI